MYDVGNGYVNPWDQIRTTDISLTMELVSSLKGTGENRVTSNTTFDNRLFVLMSDTSDNGLPFGYKSYDSLPSYVYGALFSPGTPLPLLTAGYTWLNRAEAAELGWTNENASEMLSNGIQASFASFRALYDPDDLFAIGDGAAYALARVADADAIGKLQVIREEKWVALYPNGFDAWSEWRRTEIPVLTPATDAENNGEIPRRLNYPAEEPILNSSNYTSAVNRLVPPTDNNTSKIWWNQ